MLEIIEKCREAGTSEVNVKSEVKSYPIESAAKRNKVK